MQNKSELKPPSQTATYIILISGIAILLWGAILSFKYYHFGYYDWDLAFNTQAAWNMLRGETHVSLFDINFFGNHANFITFIILPIFALVQHPLTLIMIKVVVHVTTAAVIANYSLRRLGSAAALWTLILFLIFPTNIFGILYDFHYETLSTIFLALMFVFYMDKRLRAYLVTMTLLTLVKENMPLVIISFGLFGLIHRRREALYWGIIPLLIGCLSFYLLVMVIVPAFRDTHIHPFIVRYHHLGDNYSEILRTILFKPNVIWNHLTGPMNTNFIKELFGPLLLPSFCSIHVLFFISPILLQHMLSSSPVEHSIYHYYGMAIAPFIFFSAIHTMIYIKKHFSDLAYKFISVFLIVSLLAFSFSFRKTISWSIFRKADEFTEKRWKMVQAIPKVQGAISTFDFLPHLSLRKELYSFHKVFEDDFQNAEKLKTYSPFFPPEVFTVPDSVQYALIDFKDYWILSSLRKDPEKTVGHIYHFFQSGWEMINAAGDIILFKKTPSNQQPLITVQHIPFPGENLLQDNGYPVDLLNVSIDQVEQGMDRRIIPLRFNWKSNKNADGMHHFVRMSILSNERQITHQHIIGYAIYPTGVWREGEYIQEQYWMFIPEHWEEGLRLLIQTPYEEAVLQL